MARTWRYTLTNLYNALVLDPIHTRLDQSVLEAYGQPHNLSEEGILEWLLVLNLDRAEDHRTQWKSKHETLEAWSGDCFA